MSNYRHESAEEWAIQDAMAEQAAHLRRMQKHAEKYAEQLAKERHARERVIEESEAERQYDADRRSA